MAAVYVNNIAIDAGEDFTQDYTLSETGGKVIDLSAVSYTHLTLPTIYSV